MISAFRVLKASSNLTFKSRTSDYLLSTTTTAKPAIVSIEPDIFSAQQECLDYHNYFRSLHNVPPLQLDARLARTAKRWADVLAENAPTHPFITNPTFNQTANWPHSDRGTIFRGNGIGENIAWDLSPEGSPLRQSVLRWYAEIFDFDEMNPTRSCKKPTGHYTQLLWKSSTLICCAVSVKNILRCSYTYQSTYTVAYYAPSGNIRLSTAEETEAMYATNVLSLDKGSCMSPRSCSVYKNQRSRCLGVSNMMTCKCDTDDAEVFGGRPRCFGSGGCIVVCKKPPHAEYNGYYLWQSECQGEWSCECIHYPKNGRAGAVCT